MARSLKGGQTRLIGLILADITNPYSVEVMRGIETACRKHGFTLLVCNTNNELDQEQHYLQLLSSYRVEGIVVNAVGMREEALSTLQQFMLPMVLIDRKIPDFACDVVDLNNHEAATIATEHLLQRGFKAIFFLSEPIGTVNTRLERLHAFKQTMAQHSGLLAEQAETPLNGPQQLEQVLSGLSGRHRGLRKAVISANGALTLQVARAMRRLSIQWGGDIGLLGFDELEWAELAGVGITTLKQPTYQMGHAALEQWVQRIQAWIHPSASKCFAANLSCAVPLQVNPRCVLFCGTPPPCLRFTAIFCATS